jgi:hypothetical protein
MRSQSRGERTSWSSTKPSRGRFTVRLALGPARRQQQYEGDRDWSRQESRGLGSRGSASSANIPANFQYRNAGAHAAIVRTERDAETMVSAVPRRAETGDSVRSSRYQDPAPPGCGPFDVTVVPMARALGDAHARRVRVCTDRDPRVVERTALRCQCPVARDSASSSRWVPVPVRPARM